MNILNRTTWNSEQIAAIVQAVLANEGGTAPRQLSIHNSTYIRAWMNASGELGIYLPFPNRTRPNGLEALATARLISHKDYLCLLSGIRFAVKRCNRNISYEQLPAWAISLPLETAKRTPQMRLDVMEAKIRSRQHELARAQAVVREYETEIAELQAKRDVLAAKAEKAEKRRARAG